MNAPRSPHAHRLHDYEAGWLTLLIQMGVATTEEATKPCAGLRKLELPSGRLGGRPDAQDRAEEKKGPRLE